MFTISTRLFTLWLLTSLCALPALSAELSSTIDRTRLSVNETLTLTVRYTEQTNNKPDFSALEQDFDLLSQQQNHQMSIINGNHSAYTLWRLSLLPKRTGTLRIPAFTFGGATSNVIEVNVSKARGRTTQAKPQNIFIETAVDKDQVYVQEQLILSHLLFTRVNLSDLNSEDLTIANANVLKIADNQYQTSIDGIAYLVVERKYAIFPQASGNLTIPSIRYSITMPNGRDPFPSFFNRGTQTFLRTEAQQITVKPQPVDAALEHWLPSTNLRLKEEWSRSVNEIRVGEPITRTITVIAEGLTSNQLPPLAIPEAKNFKRYPDQAQTRDEQQETGVIGKRSESLAIVPTQAGDISLPALNIHWWDTTTNQRKTTTLPSQTLHVLPALAVDLPAEPPSTTVNSLAVNTASDSRLITASLVSNGLLFAMVLFLLWHNHRLQQRRSHTDAPAEQDHCEQQLYKRLRLAANGNDYGVFQQALLAWARAFWQDDRLYAMAQIIQRANCPELATLSADLDKRAYSLGTDSAPLDLLPVFQWISTVRQQAMTKQAGKKTLAPLYA